jgi:hypothetical protein
MNAIDHLAKHNKYFTGHIAIGDDKWLILNRTNSCVGDGESVEILVLDKELQSTTLLGELFHGRWHTPNDSNANMLWKLLKQYRYPIQRVMCNLKTPINEFKPFILEWQCFKRRFRLQSIKAKRKLIKN